MAGSFQDFAARRMLEGAARYQQAQAAGQPVAPILPVRRPALGTRVR